MTRQHNLVEESDGRGSIPITCNDISVRQHIQTFSWVL